MLKASTDLLRTTPTNNKGSQPYTSPQKIKDIEEKIACMEKAIESIRGQQEEFKEEFVKLNKILEKASESITLLSKNCSGLATTQAMIAQEIVRINSSFEDLIESIQGPEGQIDLRFFSDDDIYH